MSKRQNGKSKVLIALEKYGPQTVAELADTTGLLKEGVRYAVDMLVWERQVHASHEMRQELRCRARIFALGEGPADEDPNFFHRRSEREAATADNERTLDRIRSSYIPGIFDPFRVLRVQVGA